MRILKAELLVLALLIVASPAVAGTQYYVRTDGNDNCNGRFNLPGTSGDCAYKTLARALDPNFSPGDDLQIGAGTYNEKMVLPPDLDRSLTPSDPTVIAGDPGVSRLQVVIAGGAGDQETIYSPPGVLAQKTAVLTIRHLRFKAGTKFGIHLDGRHEDITLADLEVTPDDFPPAPGICCRMDSEESAALIRVRHANNFTTKITVIDSRFTAPSSYTEDGISGVKASTMFIQAKNALIRRVESSHFLGAFAGEISDDSKVEDCVISNTTCSDFDGCVSSYNDLRVTIRRNVFHTFRPSETFPAVKVRRTNAGQPAASVIAYNNTFIGKPGTSTGAAEIGMEWPVYNPDSSYETGASVFINNLLLELGNDAMTPTGYPVLMRQCAGSEPRLDSYVSV